MILVDRTILSAMADGTIVIEPFDRDSLGTNSYDVHLAPVLRTYLVQRDHNWNPIPLSVKARPETQDHVIGVDGFVLQPGELYLASTVEYTESHCHVPFMNGKSSLGRLGLSIHVTAGTGDVGFCNHWTLELFTIKPLRIFAGMPIGQLLWMVASDTPDVPYGVKQSAKYGVRSALPMPSEMERNFNAR